MHYCTKYEKKIIKLLLDCKQVAHCAMIAHLKATRRMRQCFKNTQGNFVICKIFSSTIALSHLVSPSKIPHFGVLIITLVFMFISSILAVHKLKFKPAYKTFVLQPFCCCYIVAQTITSCSINKQAAVS